MWVRKTMEYSEPPVMTHKPALQREQEREVRETQRGQHGSQTVY